MYVTVALWPTKPLLSILSGVLMDAYYNEVIMKIKEELTACHATEII